MFEQAETRFWKEGVQFSEVANYDMSSDTGATNISFGVEHKYAKNTKVYFVFTRTNNDANAQFGLAESGTAESFMVANPGDSARGMSFGVVQKF